MSESQYAGDAPEAAPNLSPTPRYCVNLQNTVIMISEDRLKVLMHDHMDGLNASDRWQAPASVLVTLVAVFATSSFRDAYGASKDTWQAVFIVATIASVLWLLHTLKKAFRAKGTLDDLLSAIKNETPNNSPSK